MNFFGDLLNQTASDANREAQERFEKMRREFTDKKEQEIHEKLNSNEIKKAIEERAKDGKYSLNVHDVSSSIYASYYIAHDYNNVDIAREEYDKSYQDQQEKHFTCDAWRRAVTKANRKGNLPARLLYKERINTYSQFDDYIVRCEAFLHGTK